MALDEDAARALLPRLYDAALDDGGWADILAALAAATGSVTGALQLADRPLGATAPLAFHNVDAESGRLYREHYFRRDLFVQRADPSRFGAPALSHHAIRDDEMARSEIYTDFLRPRLGGGFYNVGIAQAVPGAGLLILGLQRDRRRGPFEEDTGPLRLVWRHLVHAMTIRARLRLAEAAEASAQAIVDAAPVAILLLHADGRVARMNRGAERLLAARDGASLTREGRLALAPAAQDRALRAAVAAMASLAGEPAERALRVPREGRAPLLLLVAPFAPGRCVRRDGEPPLAMVLLSDPEARPAGLGARAAALFGLSPAEAALAEALAAGTTPEAFAAARGVRITTVRTQLQRLLVKTETRRQPELLRLLLSIPAPGGAS